MSNPYWRSTSNITRRCQCKNQGQCKVGGVCRGACISHIDAPVNGMHVNGKIQGRCDAGLHGKGHMRLRTVQMIA